MKNEHKVLACVDQSRFADVVTDYAAWAAQRMRAPLELLHIIDQHPETATSQDHSGSIGIDSQEQLLSVLTEEDAVKNKMAREVGRVLLTRLRERTRAFGIEASDIRQRHGNLIETLSEQEQDVRLFVLGRRGESADRMQRDLGHNVEMVVRSLHKPILTITEGFSEPQHICIAFDGGLVTRKGIEMVAASPLFEGLTVHVLMSGRETKESSKRLNWAKTKLEQANFDAPAHLIPGDAESVIATFVQDNNIDMLIMGAYSHSPLRSWLFGSKTADLLRLAKIPTLLLR
jgi:nucleotide-binding universal stress UspA family protein